MCRYITAMVISIIMLLQLTYATASADWYFELICLDPEYASSCDGMAQLVGTEFELRYQAEGADDGSTWDTSGGDFYFSKSDPTAIVTVTNNMVLDFGMIDFYGTTGDNTGSSGFDVAVGAIPSPPPFPPNPIALPDGALLATISSDKPINLYFDINESLFQVNHSNDGNGGVTSDGLELYSNLHLSSNYSCYVPYSFCSSPNVVTGSASVCGNIVTLNGNLATGCLAAPMCGEGFEEYVCSNVWFEYGLIQGGAYNYYTTPLGIEHGVFSHDLNGLQPNTTYYYRAMTYSCCSGNVYGQEQSFTTLGPTQVSQYVSGTGQYHFGGQVNCTIDVTSLTSSGTITIIVNPNEFHPAGSGDSVKRWFEITCTASGTFKLTLSYDDGELGSEVEGDLCLWRYSGGWDGPYIGTVDTLNNTVTVNDISQFSDWIIADERGPQPPVPEIITIVLVGLGAIALEGYIYYRRCVFAT